MRKWIVATVTVATLGVLTGCSSGSKAGPVTTAAATSASAATTVDSKTTTPAPTKAPIPDLKTKVLSITDMPSGWAIDNSADSSGTGMSCFDAIGNKMRSGELARQEVGFSQGSTTKVGEVISYFNDGVAAKNFAAGTAILDGCKTVSLKQDDGSTVTGTVGRMSFKTLGDQSASYAISLDASGFTLGLTMTLVQKGGYLGLLTYAGPGSPDMTEYTALADKAMAKLTA